MDDWLQYAKEINAKIDQMNKDRSRKGVAISTMHKAKGLEWDTVFILGADDGTIPSKKAVDQGNLEEERRLFYVAVTRAKRELYLSYTDNDSTKKSRFVSEMFGVKKKMNSKKEPKFKKGQRVYHKEYGKGTVIQMIPGAVAVKFDDSVVICKFQKNQLYQLKPA